MIDRRSLLCAIFTTACLRAGSGLAQVPQPPLDAANLEAIVRATLAARAGYRAGDLIAKGDVSAVFQQLELAGWSVAKQNEILKLVLDDGHFLVRELRTPAGLKFARATAKEPNAFDRLDRLSKEPGGEKLIRTLIHLPDGTNLMKKKPTPAFGDLTDLLPKQANGRTPNVKDFSKPTGKIYTENSLIALLKRLLPSPELPTSTRG
jgi:hypothetical protein